MQISIMDTGLVSGWVLEARVHFGHHLTHYIGVSVFVKEFSASFLARTSSLLLCVGVGSYLAYRLCLKLLGCPNLNSLLTRLKSDCFWNSDNANVIGKTTCDNLKPCQINDTWSSTKSIDGAISVSKDDTDTESTRLTDISDQVSTNFAQKYFWFNDRLRSNSVEAFLPPEHGVSRNRDDETSNESNSRLTDFDEPKRTRALSDEDCYQASTSSGSMHSPPPIRRRTKAQNLERPTSVPYRDTSTSRCSSSQAFAWDPVFTPCSMDDAHFRALDEALTNNNFDEYSPASLIERFLASLDDEATAQGDRLNRQFLSPGPSEVSEFSVAVDKELGDQTVDNMERLHGDLKDLKSEVKIFYEDFGKYFDERKQWITGKDYSKEMYRSVVVVPSSSSDTASVISSSKSTPHTPKRSSRKRWTTSSLKLPEKKKKKKNIKPFSFVQDSGFGAGTSSFYDSYHTQISADMHASQSSEGCPDGKHCESRPKPKVSLTSSFVDSCISMDFRSISSSGSSENILLNANFNQIFVPSLGVTPEDRDGEGMSTTGSVRPSSLEWDEMESNSFIDENDNEFSRNRFEIADNAIDLSRYVRARFPGNERCQKAARHLAKRRRLCYTKLIEDGHDSLIRACLEGIRINKLPIFKCTTYQTVKDAVDVWLKRCSYVSQFACTSSSSRTEEIVENLELLWQFHENILTSVEPVECFSLSSTRDEKTRKLVQGVKVLMMLRMVEVYEQISFTRQSPLPFYNELFRNRTPRCVAKQLNQCGISRSLNELEMALMSDTLGFVLELYKFDSTNPSIVYTFPEQSSSSTVVVPSSMNRVAVGSFGSRNFMPLL